MKKLKKKKFNFRPQKIIIFYRSRTNFWKTCQDSKRITLPPSTWDVYGKSRIFVTIAWSCEKWEPISWPMGHFDPASFRASCPVNDYFVLNYRNMYIWPFWVNDRQQLMMGLCGCAADTQPKNSFDIMQQFSVFIDVQCTYTPLKYVWGGLFLARNHDNHKSWVSSMLLHNVCLISSKFWWG